VEAVPLYNTNPPPQYPRVAVKRGYQGVAELMVLVNKNGFVDDVWLFESSGYSILDEAALQSVKDWSFTPGKQGDQAIDMWVRVPVRFQLQ
jgi:protein TonB